MKRFAGFCLFLLLFVVCAETQNYPRVIYIHIEGTDGLPFAGSYSTVEEEIYVVDYVPTYYVTSLQVYEDTEDVFIGCFHKCVEPGTLTVRLFVADYGEQSELVVDEFTVEPYGDISIRFPN